MNNPKEVKKDQFYFQGKYFDNENEFWAYVKEWPNLNLDPVTMYRLFDTFKEDCVINFFLMSEKSIKNGEMNKILEETFMFFMKKINKENEHE